MCVSTWNSMGRYCDALVKLESKVCQAWTVRVFKMADVGLHFWQMGYKVMLHAGTPWFYPAARLPSSAAWLRHLPEVRFIGDNEGHARKPVSLYWLQRKPQVIRLDIDIKFLVGSLSHFKSLEDCSSHLKICTQERSDELSCEMAISLYWPRRQFKVNSLDWDIQLLYA